MPNNSLTEVSSYFLKPFNDELDGVFKTEARSTEEIQIEIEELNVTIAQNGLKSNIFQRVESLQCGS